MKKLFTILAVAATLVSCAKEEVVSVNREAIGFDNAFIDNATRSVSDPSFSSAEDGKMFENFAVYGTVEGATLFDRTEVKGSGLGEQGTWSYDETQYWIAGAKYNFAAIAPYSNGVEGAFTAAKNDADEFVGTTTFSFTNTGVNDLLYAQTGEIEGKGSGNSVIEFTFRHLLSKVKFSFANKYNASNATIKVYDIKITNAYESATVTLGETTTAWSAFTQNDTTPLVLDFGAATQDTATENVAEAYAFNTTLESYNELFIIPGAIDGGYTVTFKVDLLVGGTMIDTYEHSVTADFTPIAGNAYDIAAEITAKNIDPEHAQEAIEFTVKEIDGWNDNNATMEVPEPSTETL